MEPRLGAAGLRRVARNPSCRWDTSRASLGQLSTVGDTEHKGKNNSVVGALVSLAPGSGEFRGAKQSLAPDKASLLPQMLLSLAMLHPGCALSLAHLWLFSPYLLLIPGTEAVHLLSPRLEVHAKPGAGTEGGTKHNHCTHFSELTSQGN